MQTAIDCKPRATPRLRTQHDLIVHNLKLHGYAEVPGASSRYTVLYKEGSSVSWAWVGRAGAIRFSGTKRVDSSRPATERTRAILLKQPSN